MALAVDALVKNLLQRCPFLEVHMTPGRLRLRYGKGSSRNGRKPALQLEVFPSGHIYCPGNDIRDMDVEQVELDRWYDVLRGIDSRLVPRLDTDGKQRNRKGVNCAPIRDVYPRLKEIEDVLADFAEWFQKEIKRAEAAR